MSASWWSRSSLTLFAWLLLVAAAVVSDATAAQLTATWTDNSSGQAAFEIVRRAENEFDYSTIANVPAGSQSYVDSSVVEGPTYCYRVRAYTAAGASAYSNEACAFVAAATPVQPASVISITKGGTGNGVISSGASGAVICDSNCTATSLPSGGVITLVAVPGTGSRFAGWSGGCSGTGPCTVAGNQAVTVMATFSATVQAIVTISKGGTGNGVISAGASGGVAVVCDWNCVATSFPPGAGITLIAVPGPGSIFAGWSGGCSGTGPCTVAANQGVSVTATFSLM